MYFPDNFAGLTALSERMHRFVMRRAYMEARHFGYSRRGSFRVALLTGRLSLRDPPTDTWGRRGCVDHGVPR